MLFLTLLLQISFQKKTGKARKQFTFFGKQSDAYIKKHELSFDDEKKVFCECPGTKKSYLLPVPDQICDKLKIITKHWCKNGKIIDCNEERDESELTDGELEMPDEEETIMCEMAQPKPIKNVIGVNQFFRTKKIVNSKAGARCACPDGKVYIVGQKKDSKDYGCINGTILVASEDLFERLKQKKKRDFAVVCAKDPKKVSSGSKNS